MPDLDDPMVELLTTRQVAELVRVSYRELDYWTRKGYLPVGDVTPGSGYPRRWWPDEVERARVFAELVHAGVSPSAVAEALPTALIGSRRFAISLGALLVTGELS